MNSTETEINYQELLRLLGACDEARRAAGSLSMREVWESTERGDWLLWLAARLEIDRRLIVYAAAQCARQSLRFVPEGEDRPRKAIEAAEAWSRGEISAAAAAAYAAYAVDAGAYAVGAVAVAAAAYAAAYAAYAVGAARVAAAAAAYAVDAAEIVRSIIPFHEIEAVDAARNESCKQSAEIVRSIIPFHEIEAAARRILTAKV